MTLLEQFERFCDITETWDFAVNTAKGVIVFLEFKTLEMNTTWT
jgi:hypothetical protein